MQNSNQATIQNSNFDWNIAGFRCQPGLRIWQVYQVAESAKIAINKCNLSFFSISLSNLWNLKKYLKVEDTGKITER